MNTLTVNIAKAAVLAAMEKMEAHVRLVLNATNLEEKIILDYCVAPVVGLEEPSL